MPADPFKNVLPTDADESTFTDVEATSQSDTTTETGVRPADSPTEPAPGVEGTGSVHVAGEDETPGDEPSGTDTSRS